MAAGALAVMSLYLITSTFFALIIVTLPGMYPMTAIKTAGDMVVGRRLRILFRLIWMLFCVALLWIVIMIPVIMLDSWVKSTWSTVNWLPVVPIFLLAVSSATVVFVSSYIYLFYRKVVADEADPT
jgi:hypothetical protein